MCSSRWMAASVLGSWVLIATGGCVSLDQHRRLQAQHRTVVAEKEALSQELYDTRNANDSLRTRVTSLEGEVTIKGELASNLRSENELLDEMRKIAQADLEEMAGRQTLSPINIAAPRLPKLLDNALKTFANEHPTEVVYDAARGTVKWKADLLFAAGSDVVRESSHAALQGFAGVIQSPVASDFEVIVVGHTDTQPIKRARAKHPTNWHLSAHRAISVAGILRKDGYAPERTSVMGCGEYRPIADNTSKQGRSQNRRVEIYLVPSGSIVATADAGPHGAREVFASVRLSR